MHIIRILRDYLGITQTQLAQRAGLRQAEICKMENFAPRGGIEKYQQLASYLGIPIHALVSNDCRLIPVSFFEENSEPKYKKAASYVNIANGRSGEEYVFEQERKRVSQFSTSLARLIMPYYKMQRTPGFDILSFNEEGEPIYIEVKTTQAGRQGSVLLTQKEQEKAEQLFQKNKSYQIHSLTNWGKPAQKYSIYEYEVLRVTARMVPTEYVFILNPAKTISGITHFRQKAGLSQYELADALGITQSKMCLYENKDLPCPVTVMYKMACLLETTVDELLQEFEPMIA